MKSVKDTLIKYVITTALGGVISVIALMARGFFELESIAERYRALADAFTIPGVVLLMVGIILLISKDGFFDIVTYGLGRLGRALIPFSKKTDEQFYDYKVRKAEARASSSGYGFVFIVGAVFMAVGILFTVLFFTA